MVRTKLVLGSVSCFFASVMFANALSKTNEFSNIQKNKLRAIELITVNPGSNLTVNRTNKYSYNYTLSVADRTIEPNEMSFPLRQFYLSKSKVFCSKNDQRR